MKRTIRSILSCLPCGLCLMLLLAGSCRKDKKGDISGMEAGFKNIPDSVKISIYWYWINGNISEAGVTHDLESMAKTGIGRAYIGNIGLTTAHGDSSRQVRLFSEKWWNVLGRTFKVADSLGIDIGMFNSPGWSQSGGPWIKPDQAMRYLAYNTFPVAGPVSLHKKLIVPDGNFQRMAVLAFPAPKDFGATMQDYGPEVSTSLQTGNIHHLIDGDTATDYVFSRSSPDTSWTVTLDFAKEITARSLLLYPAHIPFQANVALQVKKNHDFHTVKEFHFDRTNANKNVGFMPYPPVAISFQEVSGKQFRLIFSSLPAKGGLAEIVLTPRPYLERFAEKQLGKMFQTPQPLWDAYRWKGQATSYPASLLIQPDAVINITDHVSGDGTLNWEVPGGNWVVMQTGMVPTGVTNAPATPEATGLEVDKMSKKELKNHFDGFIGKILTRFAAEDRKAFKYVVADSYETGSQNWTDGFAEDFRQQYGYDPLPWLPVLSGLIVGNADRSDRFLWDVRRRIADRVAYQYVGGLRELSHEHGLKVWLENYGHWGFPAEFLQYGGQSDEVSGEFWAEGDLGDIELKDASSAAHIYGKNKVYAESLTAAGRTFQRSPRDLKIRGDWAFTQGVNSTLLHVYISQPTDSISPGINAWFGTEFNRKNTWFSSATSYFDYLRRCNFMLQQGRPVVDVAYYIGEDAPRMTGIQDPPLPKGYSFDYINAEVIENSLTVKDGDLVLPDGISYKLLILPPEKTMRPQMLKKIMELVKAGATVLGPKPGRSPSLQNYPEADNTIKEWAAELWQNCDGNKIKMAHYGQGMILDGMSMEEALDRRKVVPDFKADPAVPVLFVHRKTDEADIYFVSNQRDSVTEVLPAFRVLGKKPAWWDPVTGTTRPLPRYRQQENGTEVPLRLAAGQSGFVVFSEKTNLSSAAGNNFPPGNIRMTMSGPWKVTFDHTMRGPASPVIFNTLTDWSGHTEDSIQYFSGAAAYEASFNMEELPKDSLLFLDLGEVDVIAQVVLNGKETGSVWTAPWRVNITNALKQGENKLIIRVTNTWVNRLIGDSKLPPSGRKTRADINPYTPESPLEPSGLLGPVTIISVKYPEKANE